MAFPTKIMRYDLVDDLIQIFDDLDNFQGEESALLDALNKAASPQENTVDEAHFVQAVRDRLDAFDTTNDEQDTRMDTQDTRMIELNIQLNQEGNYSETFGYDENGNVETHTVTGDIAYTITYVYADAVNGILNYSEKSYTKSNGDGVVIKKTYTYDNGNITGVATTTTITPAAPPTP